MSPTSVEQIDAWRAAKSETEHLEFKEAKNQFSFDDLLKYCVAIGNEGGGHIVLGVANKPPRPVVGTSAFSDTRKTATELLNKLHFRVEVEEVRHPSGRVLVFHIPPRPPRTPLQIGGAYYMRSGESLVAMTSDQLGKILREDAPSGQKTTALLIVALVVIVALISLGAYRYWLSVRQPKTVDQNGTSSIAPTQHPVVSPEKDKERPRSKAGDKEDISIAVEWAMVSYGGGEYATPFWVSYRIPAGCAIAPVQVALFIRVKNLKNVPVTVTGYGVDTGFPLTRLPTDSVYSILPQGRALLGTKIGDSINFSQGPGFSMVHFATKESDFSQAKLLQLDSFDNLISKPLEPHIPVRGWAFFEYHNEKDFSFGGPLRVHVRTDDSRVYTREFNLQNPDHQWDTLKRLMLVKSSENLSACQQRFMTASEDTKPGAASHKSEDTEAASGSKTKRVGTSDLKTQQEKEKSKAPLDTQNRPGQQSNISAGNVTAGPCSNVSIGGAGNQSTVNCNDAHYGNLGARCIELGGLIAKLVEERRKLEPSRPSPDEYYAWYSENDFRFRRERLDDVVKLTQELAAVHVRDSQLENLLEKLDDYFKRRNQTDLAVVRRAPQVFFLSIEEIEEIGVRITAMARRIPG